MGTHDDGRPSWAYRDIERYANPTVSGTIEDRPTIDVTGLAATGLTIGPDEILVLFLDRHMSPSEVMRHREVIETVLPRDRYLILQGWTMAKLPKDVAEQAKRALEAP